MTIRGSENRFWPSRCVLLVAGALTVLVGCGGISEQGESERQTTTVVVETLKKGTDELLDVPAEIVVAGVWGQTDVQQGWAIIQGVPLGENNPPEQPLTVTAPGWVTVSRMIELSPYSYTPVTVEMEEADPQQTATVQGTVTAANPGEPLTSALVAFTPSGGGDTVSGFTARDGHYKIGGIPAGPVEAIAQAVGYLEETKQVTLTPDALGSNPPVDFALFGGTTRITVTGQVVQVGLDTPVPDAQVTIGSKAPVTTDANGEFAVDDVLVGRQVITVTATGFDEKQEEIEATPGMAPLLILLAPTSPEPPGKPYTITGQVALLGKVDNAGATVTAQDKTSGEILDTDVTDAEGNYYLFVPPGSYRLTVEYNAHSLGRDVVLLGGGRVLTDIDFTLTVT